MSRFMWDLTNILKSACATTRMTNAVPRIQLVSSQGQSDFLKEDNLELQVGY